MSKPKVAFYWSASCGGCEESVVDLAEKILDVLEVLDFAFFPVAMDFKKSDVEAMADGELAVAFINGAIRTSEHEEMAHLLRRKSQVVIAYGSCAHLGGIPGLGNLHNRAEIFKRVYEDIETVKGDKVFPQTETKVPEGTVTLPEFWDTVRTLDQTVDVDYYLPGCPPPVKLLADAVEAILSGQLPPKGSVLAPDKALCSDCPRKETKPETMMVKEFKRPHLTELDPEKCFLAQGLLCLGPVTRCGCDSACVNGNMPCTGCLGPLSGIQDYGAKALSTIASILDLDDKEDVLQALETMPDMIGVFYKYSLPASLLGRRQNL